ncbi:MAG: two-component sensor histidine kinase [Candidatus Kapaibacterium sp.]|nr:MAG: two-component sensor histidine kinase [Candidatus Kapabacteria bacterium]
MPTLLRRLPLRWRLTLWYAALVTVALGAFGGALYRTVSESLSKNLDASLSRAVTSLDYIVKQKQQESRRPLRSPRRRRNALLPFEAAPPRDSLQRDTATDEPDVVWMAIYEHILLNTRTFAIQIADTAGTLLWHSSATRDTFPTFAVLTRDEQLPPPYPLLKTIVIGGEHYRVAAVRSGQVEIVVGYPLTEIEQTLAELFFALKIGLPLVFVVAVLGGYWLARYSLRQVEVLTNAAQDISARHLNVRLPMPPVNDEIARLTATLNDMIARLEQSFQQIQQFTSDASHELRTPLAILIGELELALRRPHRAEEYQAVLSSALEEVVRLSKVVDGLLELSRAESGQVAIERELVNLSQLVLDVCEDFSLLAEEHGLELRVEVQPFIQLIGDRTRLRQVLINLLDNAVKYTPRGGIIRVHLWLEQVQVHLAISDNGIGIPAEDLPHIFDRFYRVDKARSRKIGGSGLGLAIVRWIIEAHGGTIWVESTEGSGTTIHIRLPIDANAHEPTVSSHHHHRTTYAQSSTSA